MSFNLDEYNVRVHKYIFDAIYFNGICVWCTKKSCTNKYFTTFVYFKVKLVYFYWIESSAWTFFSKQKQCGKKFPLAIYFKNEKKTSHHGNAA